MRPKNTYRLDDDDLSPASNIDEICEQVLERLPDSERQSLEPLMMQLLQLIKRHDVENEKFGAQKFAECINILDDAVDSLDIASSGKASQLVDALPCEVACDEFLLIVLTDCAGDFDKFVSWFARSRGKYRHRTFRFRTFVSNYADNLIHKMTRLYLEKCEQYDPLLSQLIEVLFILLASDLLLRLERSDIPRKKYLSVEFLVEVGYHSIFEEVFHGLSKHIHKTQQFVDGSNLDALHVEITRLINAAHHTNWRARSLSLPTFEPSSTYATWGELLDAEKATLHNNIGSAECTADALELATTETYRFDDYLRALVKVLVVHQASIIDDSLISLSRSQAQAVNGHSLRCVNFGMLSPILHLDILKQVLKDKQLPVSTTKITLLASTSDRLYLNDLIAHVLESQSDSREKFNALWFLRQVRNFIKQPMKDISEIFEGKDRISLHPVLSSIELSQDEWLSASTLVKERSLKISDQLGYRYQQSD